MLSTMYNFYITDTQNLIHFKQNDRSTYDTVNLLDIKVAKYVT